LVTLLTAQALTKKLLLSIMKIVAFALVVVQASALLHRNGTAKVHLAAKKNAKAAKAHQDPEENGLDSGTPILDPIERRREERAADKAHQKALKEADGGDEIEPMDGTCSHNTLRCIYVHELPRDYCMVTGQPPWCVQYVGEPACVMVVNYDKYVEAKADETQMAMTCEERQETSCKIDHHESNYPSTLSTSDFGRWLLGGKGEAAKGDHNAMQCEGTRGWGKPRYLDPENPGELPSCKSNQAMGLCESHSGHRTDLKCPSCGDTAGQTQGATHNNDVTHGGGLR